MKQFKLTRQLAYGTKGEDVKLMQKLLNIANGIYLFYDGSVPENGTFDMFRTRVCLSQFQDWCELDRTYCYNQTTHRQLIQVANTALEMRHAPSSMMYAS